MLETVRTRNAFPILVAAALVLGACSTPTPAPIPTALPTVIPTLLPAATETLPAPDATAIPDIGVPVIETPAPGDPAAMASYNTYLFGGPGKEYVVYGTMLGGETAKIVGSSENGAWWAVSVPPAPQGIGWVDDIWVTVSGADSVPTLPAPPLLPTSPEGFELPPLDPQATALVNTYVRSGPDIAFPAYAIAQAGAIGRVIGKNEDGNWWVIRLNPGKVGAGFGWVSASTVEAINTESVVVVASPSDPQPVEVAPPPDGAPAVVAVEYVSFRTGPATCYAGYGVGAPGAKAEVAGKSADGEWFQVRIPVSYVPSGLAWVGADYVIPSNTDAVPTIATEPCPEVPVPAPAAPYACSLASQDPADNTTMPPGTLFSMAWSVQNIGNSDWTDAVLRFTQSGSLGAFHTGPDSIVIGTVAAGTTYTSSVPAISPLDHGIYDEVWEIFSGGKPVCGFYMIVEAPAGGS